MVPEGYTLGWNSGGSNLPVDGCGQVLLGNKRRPANCLHFGGLAGYSARIASTRFISMRESFSPSGNVMTTLYTPPSQGVCARYQLDMFRESGRNATYVLLAGHSNIPDEEIQRITVLSRSRIEALSTATIECISSASSMHAQRARKGPGDDVGAQMDGPFAIVSSPPSIVSCTLFLSDSFDGRWRKDRDGFASTGLNLVDDLQARCLTT